MSITPFIFSLSIISNQSLEIFPQNSLESEQILFYSRADGLTL